MQPSEMQRTDRLGQAETLMADFAAATGLTTAEPPTRYLWTDAFAVCNFVGLAQASSGARYTDLALKLVAQVHQTLGRHRADDLRSGWISGLSEEEGGLHPTSGGLRIGKQVNERPPEQPLDHQQEWQRDGQYFHYLTKWMHALHVVAQHTGEQRYLRWASELAAVAHDRFTFMTPAGDTRLVWKMSIGLSRPLVPAMGQHDPLDALVTYRELAHVEGDDGAAPDLERPIEEARELCRASRWATDDALGIGGLLDAASRLGRIAVQQDGVDRDLFTVLLRETRRSLEHFAQTFNPDAPAGRRLAFRELGLAIGLSAMELTQPRVVKDPDLARAWGAILEFRPLGGQIERFWQSPAGRDEPLWREHAAINTVMLATALAPTGYVPAAAPARK